MSEVSFSTNIAIWRHATGGGRPVDYLRWLSAMWEIYHQEMDLLYVEEELFDDYDNLIDWVNVPIKNKRVGFSSWLLNRFSEEIPSN